MKYAKRSTVTSSTSPRDLTAETSASTAQAPGAVPPTGGVPPEDAAGAGGATTRSASEDLADGLDLMLRAARKALHSVDPRLEEAAQRALARLQQLDADSSASLRDRSGIDPQQVRDLASEVGRELASTLERVTQRVEAVLGRRR